MLLLVFFFNLRFLTKDRVETMMHLLSFSQTWRSCSISWG